MEKEQMIEKIGELMRESDYETSLREQCESIINSGALPISEEPIDSFARAKVILSIALQRIAFQYSPLSEPYKGEYKDLGGKFV